eukprot:13818742-Alexandrium_andersonii.AAC.1
MVIQQACDLRPSEVLGLEAEDVLLPQGGCLEHTGAVVLALGARTGTKAKRPQSVLVRPEHGPAFVLLHRCCALVSGHWRVFPYIYEQCLRVLKR